MTLAGQMVRVHVDGTSIDSSVTLSQILMHRTVVADPPASILQQPQPPPPQQQQQQQEPEQSPSTLYASELEFSKKAVSSEKKQHRFWLPSDLEIPISVLEEANGYAGSIVHSTDNTIFVEENIEDCQVLPLYVADLIQYTETDCRDLFRQMCELVLLLHNFHCVHRHIHLNNFAVDRSGKVLLRGFHHAIMLNRHHNNGKLYTDIPHSEHRKKYDWFAFRAPELDDGNDHDEAVDVWSLGVCLYMMLTGLPPFRGKGRVLRKQKREAKIADYEMVVPTILAQDLLCRMLTARPENRITVEEILQHEWFTDEIDAEGSSLEFSMLELSDLSLSQSFLQDWGRINKIRAHGNRRGRSHERSRRISDSQRPSSPSGILLP